MPGLVFVTVGSADDASALVPSMHIFTKSKQPWDKTPGGAASFAKMPG